MQKKPWTFSGFELPCFWPKAWNEISVVKYTAIIFSFFVLKSFCWSFTCQLISGREIEFNPKFLSWINGNNQFIYSCRSQICKIIKFKLFNMQAKSAKLKLWFFLLLGSKIRIVKLVKNNANKIIIVFFILVNNILLMILNLLVKLAYLSLKYIIELSR